MSAMIERVAKAAAAARFGTIVDRLYWESDAWRKAHIDIAVACISAMREPTADMVDAMRDVGPDAPYGMSETIERWHAGIEAALDT